MKLQNVKPCFYANLGYNNGILMKISEVLTGPEKAVQNFTTRENLALTIQDQMAKLSKARLKKEVRDWPGSLQFVSQSRITDEIAKIAIDQDPETIRFVENPSEELQMYAISQGAQPRDIKNITPLVLEICAGKKIIKKWQDTGDIHACQEALYDAKLPLAAKNIVRIFKYWF